MADGLGVLGRGYQTATLGGFRAPKRGLATIAKYNPCLGAGILQQVATASMSRSYWARSRRDIRHWTGQFRNLPQF